MKTHRRYCADHGVWRATPLLLLLLSPQAAAQRPPVQALVPTGILELTPQQREAVRKLQSELHARDCELTGQIIEARSDARDLYAASEPDAREVGEAMLRIWSLQQELAAARTRVQRELEALLTDAQRERYRRWRANDQPSEDFREMPWPPPGIERDVGDTYDDRFGPPPRRPVHRLSM